VTQLSFSFIFAILLGFFIVSVTAPVLILYVLIFTFGFGFPLLFLNTVFLYVVAALPLFFMLRKVPFPRPAVVLAAASLIPAVAFIPPGLTKVLATWQMQQYRKDDMSAALAEAPKAVEIAGAQRYYGGPNSTLKNAPCETLCQSLLLSRSVDLVRVTRGPAVGPIPSAQLDYRIEQRPNCSNAFGDDTTVLPRTKEAVAAGVCFVAQASDSAPVNTRIVLRHESKRPPQNLAGDLRAGAGAVSEIRSFEIQTPGAAGWTPKVRQTQIKYLYLQFPTMIFFARCPGLCIGDPVFVRTEGVLNSFDFDRAVLDVLRVKEAPAQAIDWLARVVGVLDNPGEALNEDQRWIINDWAKGLLQCARNGCAAASEREREVLLRLIRDRRVTDFVFVGEVIARNPSLVVSNLDLFIDEMEGRGINSPLSGQIGAIIASLDVGQLLHRRDRVLALIEASDWKWPRGIGMISGRLGADTTHLIARHLNDPASAETALLAACTADEAVGRQLVPDLLAYLRALPASDDIPRGAARDAVKSLARFGHFEEAKEIFLARYPKFGKRSLPVRSAAEVAKNVKACFSG
jgi:hypothetical protein